MTRTLLFHRDFQRYSGGHGKMWDYFRHVAAMPGWSPRVYLTARSVDGQNPWRTHAVDAATTWAPGTADALMLGGLDWEAYATDDPATPVLNLVQHVRHGDPKDPRFPYLRRAAIRICVSQEVADAISRHTPNGPVLVIEAGIGLPAVPPTGARSGVFIDAIKQPKLGEAVAQRLAASGHQVRLNTMRIPRDEYLAQLSRARVAVVLPRATEGFYLPGLEAMAMGCATVVPDCVGNRAYLAPGRNALTPALEADAVAAAVGQLDDPELSGRLTHAGTATAARFSLDRERTAFHRVLGDLPALWRETRMR